MLVTAAAGDALASDIRKLEVYSIRRSITQPTHDAVHLLTDALGGRRVRRAAVERAGAPGLIEQLFQGAEIVDATIPMLWLRKRKEPDEIEEIRRSLRLCAVAYRPAEDDRAGANGNRRLQRNARCHHAGSRNGGSLPRRLRLWRACIQGGGQPTDRQIQPGDLYILDLFPAPAYYAGDTCRTFAAGEPTDLQQRAWERVCNAVRLAETLIRPGVKARDVYAPSRNSSTIPSGIISDTA